MGEVKEYEGYGGKEYLSAPDGTRLVFRRRICSAMWVSGWWKGFELAPLLAGLVRMGGLPRDDPGRGLSPAGQNWLPKSRTTTRLP